MSEAIKLVKQHPLPGNELRRAHCLSHDSTAIPEPTKVDAERPVTELEHANIVTSRDTRYDGMPWWTEFGGHHRPVLDVDHAVKLVESSTTGHHHLYIDRPIPWAAYQKLLTAMAECGILEWGYVDASIKRGYTAVRLPWVRKGEMGQCHRHPDAVARTPDDAGPLDPCHCLHDNPDIDAGTAAWSVEDETAWREQNRRAIEF